MAGITALRTSRSVTTDIDIWRAAKLLIDQHGNAAAIEAVKRADALAAQGDAAGAR